MKSGQPDRHDRAVNNNEPRGRSHDSPLPPSSIDGSPVSVPAAGWRNGTSLNNAGENGNYWSSTPNGSDTQNAYNLNFNSGNHDWNWNNRNNGQSVRPVSELTSPAGEPAGSRRFSISKERLLTDLFRAYRDARRNKRGKAYQLKFEYNVEDSLVALRDELISATYKPKPSTCFIIHDPKTREVFAAGFRDRIVHHLFYNYTHILFERTFIADSYSCIKGRGTHYGIDRLKRHIRSVSAGWSRPCYVLKTDIRGYFMAINRGRLLELCRDTMEKMRDHRSDGKGMTWGERIDYPFVGYLLETIVNADPTEGCVMRGSPSDWDCLPAEKSMTHAAPGCGLPIGNLSSQLFSNVYMNVFDQYVKRTLGCRHYGRYVDDAYIVDRDRERLKALIPGMTRFLRERLGLTLNADKTRIYDAREGVEFLGAYIRPFRAYVSSASLRRIRRKAMIVPKGDRRHLESAVNSLLGVMSHYNSYRLRRVLFGHESRLQYCGRFSHGWSRYRAFDAS